MFITISVSKTTASIELSKPCDIIQWENNYNLSRLILINLNNLLKKHNLKLSNIKKFEFQNQEEAGFTTSRIAETTVKILNFAKTL